MPSTLTLRTITNAGTGLVNPDGTFAKNVKISFTLCSPLDLSQPSDVWDAVTLERIPGTPVVVYTDVDGEFSVDLWPNTRGNVETVYLCRVFLDGCEDFASSLADGVTDVTWAEFFASGTLIPVGGLPLGDAPADGIPYSRQDNEWIRAEAYGSSAGVQASLNSHTGNTSNPHSTTYAQVGAEPANSNIQSHIAVVSGNPHGTTAAQVGASTLAEATQKAIAMTIVFGG